MSEYNLEQLDAISQARKCLEAMSAQELARLQRRTRRYLAFRADVDRFLKRHFSQVCTQACYRNRQSACCTREGITTFFADVVINALASTREELETLLAVLDITAERGDMKCVYLGPKGCVWRIKPIVCAMFLCKPAQKAVFGRHPEKAAAWRRLEARRKSYTWPTRPVLFDEVEGIFMEKGYESNLMYFHNSPGLLRIKAMVRRKRQSPIQSV